MAAIAMAKITIIIPSFNGRTILEKSLPQVVKHSPGAKIIIIDDGGSDDTAIWLGENYPKVRLIRNETNLGFPRSVNKGVAAARSEFIVLLNNDVYPQKGYLSEALKYFADDSVFAVTFNETHSSWPQTSWQGGKLHYTRGTDKTQAVYSTWASGGSCMLRRKYWRALKGFNPVYSPGYWEDIDLGWQAWKAGYKIVWAPLAKVIHHHESTFKALDQNWLNLVKQRNELLFIWQNISTPKLMLSHLWFLASHSFRHPGYMRVVLAALSKIGQVRASQGVGRSDEQILALVNQPLQ